jgi:hypothetical protein
MTGINPVRSFVPAQQSYYAASSSIDDDDRDTAPSVFAGSVANTSVIADPGIQLAYYQEIPRTIQSTTNVGFIPSVSKLDPQIEATRNYLIMLGGLRSLEYRIFLKKVQNTFGFDNDGKPRIDLGLPGWPGSKTFLDLLQDQSIKDLNIPKHIVSHFIEAYGKIRSERELNSKSADANIAAEAKDTQALVAKTPFWDYAEVFGHFQKLSGEYFSDIFGVGDRQGIDLVGRFQYLNGLLPKDNRMDPAALALDGKSPLTYSNLSMPALLQAVTKLNEGKASLKGAGPAIVDELVLVSLYMTIKYMMGFRTAQNSNNIKDSGDEWPKKAGNKVEWRTLVSNAAMDPQVKNNLLMVIDAAEGKEVKIGENLVNIQITKLDAGYDQVEVFEKNYVYYSDVFKELYKMAMGAPGPRIDPLDRIKQIVKNDLCSILTSASDEVTAETFDEAKFLIEVNQNVRSDNPALTACVSAMVDQQLQGVIVLWSQYIQRVYKSFGVDVNGQASDGKTVSQVIQGLIEKGIKGDQAGITNDDMIELTRTVEAMKKSGNVELTEFAYQVIGEQIHVDPASVPERLDPKDFIGTAVYRKLYYAGVKPRGATAPKSERVNK